MKEPSLIPEINERTRQQMNTLLSSTSWLKRVDTERSKTRYFSITQLSAYMTWQNDVREASATNWPYLGKVKMSTRQKDAVKQLATSAKEHLMEDATRQTARRPPCGKVSATPKPQGGATTSRCMRCGRRKYQGNEKCPARNVVCHNCKKERPL